MIIGVTGFAQHGKNEVARVLRRYGFQQVAFADGVRKLAEAVNPLVIPDIGKPNRYGELVHALGYERAKEMKEVRALLDRIGNGVREVVGEDAWIDALSRRLNELDIESENVAITDVRYPNEAEFVKGNGGRLWAVERLEKDGSPWDNGIGLSLRSEMYVPLLKNRADVLISAYTIADLESQVEAAVTRMYR